MRGVKEKKQIGALPLAMWQWPDLNDAWIWISQVNYNQGYTQGCYKLVPYKGVCNLEILFRFCLFLMLIVKGKYKVVEETRKKTGKKKNQHYEKSQKG